MPCTGLGCLHRSSNLIQPRSWSSILQTRIQKFQGQSDLSKFTHHFHCCFPIKIYNTNLQQNHNSFFPYRDQPQGSRRLNVSGTSQVTAKEVRKLHESKGTAMPLRNNSLDMRLNFFTQNQESKASPIKSFIRSRPQSPLELWGNRHSWHLELSHQGTHFTLL